MRTNPLPAAADSEQARRHLVERVVASRYFSKSARLRDLLVYVCDRVLNEGVTEIHEQEVGHQVFGRPLDYDKTSDNTVRVHASTLRKRLEQYFETEGRDEPIIIELPKGNYAPVFRERSALPVAEPEAPAEVELAAKTSVRSWQIATAVAVAVAFGALFLWQRGNQPAASPLAGKPSVKQFWSELFTPGQVTDVVLDDAGVGLYQELSGRSVGLSEYYDRSYLRHLGELPPGAKVTPEAAGSVVLKRHSSFANVNALWQLAG